MKLRFTYLLFILLTSLFSFGQSTVYVDLNKAKKAPENVKFLIVKGDSASLDTLSFYIERLGHLSGIAIQGKVENKEVLWTSLYKLRLLEQVIFINNELKQIQFGASSSTIKEVWITGSPKLNSNSLNSALSQTRYLQVLRVDGIEDSRVPSAISGLKLLSKAQFTNCNWTFHDIAMRLRSCNSLKYLDLSDNGFQLAGKEAKFLPNIKYLDISGNDLADSPDKMRYLKGLDTLVLNRNVIDNKEPTIQKLQKLYLKCLVLDPDSASRKEKLIYELPGVKFIWTDKKFTINAFVLPTGKFKVKKGSKIDSISFKSDLKDVSDGDASLKILSPAFIVYDQLYFPNPLADFDTSTFATRYLSPDYIYTHKINNQNHTRDGHYYPLKYDKSHKNWYKKKNLKKLNHESHSYVIIEIVAPPKEYTGNVLIDFHVNHLASKRSEFQSFRGIVWEALDYRNKKNFEVDYITQKTWSDVRIKYNEKTKAYSLVFKGRFENKELAVQPRDSKDLLHLDNLEKNCYRMFTRYEKALEKSQSNFDRNLSRSKQKLLKSDSQEIESLWQKVESEMSEEEKSWSREEWINYFEKLKESEFYLLANHPLGIPYFCRYIESQGFTKATGFDFYVGQKWLDFELKENDSIQLKLKEYCLLDLDRKVAKYFKSEEKNKLLFEPFHKYIFVAQLNDQKFIVLGYERLMEMLKEGSLLVRSSDFINGQPTNANFFRDTILPLLNSLNY